MKWKWSKVQKELRKLQKEGEEKIDYYYSHQQENDPEDPTHGPDGYNTDLHVQERSVKDIKERLRPQSGSFVCTSSTKPEYNQRLGRVEGRTAERTLVSINTETLHSTEWTERNYIYFNDKDLIEINPCDLPQRV
jgi:hypothetical protein